MKFITVTAAITSIITTAQAGVIAARQSSFRFECDGQLNPNVNACTDLANSFEAGDAEFRKPAGNIEDTRWFTLGDTSNCRVEIFWKDSQFVLSREQLYQGIRAVTSTCFPVGAGGSAVDVGGRYEIIVRNNPSYNPPAKRAAPTSRSRGKRADKDTSFSYGIHTIYNKLGFMKHYVGPGLPGGSTWEWTEEESVSDSTTFSTSVSAGIESLLSASLSTDISSSRSSTSGQATTITIKCQDNEIGRVYFQAYAETWSGVLLPSGQPLTVNKPMAKDGITEGFYSYDCIAK